MTVLSNANPAAEEARFALAAEGARAERRNRPRHLVLMAGVLLSIAIAYLMTSWSAAGAARERAASARSTAQDALLTAARLQRVMQAEAGDGGPQASEPASLVLSSVELAGTKAGLANPVPPPATQIPLKPQGLGTQQLRWSYAVSDASLTALLAWVEGAAADVPGLEVHALTLTPEPQNNRWGLKVTFARWERLEAR